MSFFGFDASVPNSHARNHNGTNNNNGKNQALDFEDTYKGYDDYNAADEEDFLNNETFGANAELGNDFDFGHGDNNAVAQNDSNNVQNVPHRSYVAAASSGSNQPQMDASVDMKPMESLWHSNGQQQQPMYQEPNVLSMEDIERNQRQMQMQQPAYVNPPMPNYGMPPPQNFMAPPPPQGMPNQYPMPMQQGMNQQPIPQQFQQMYQQPYNPMYVNANPNQQQQQPQQVQLQGGAPMQQQRDQYQMNQQPQQQQPPQQVQVTVQQDQGQIPMQIQQQHQGQEQVNAPVHEQQQHQNVPQPQAQMQQGYPSQQMNHGPIMDSESQMGQGNMKPHQQMRSNSGHQRQQRNRELLTPEEQKRLQIRHAKVEKILKHSGLMTPRDKDFITRYQLSQIVTEDPYNEDFYFQVYKIIQRGGVVGESNKGLIARAYLEHSGHRLGGRYKRADIALQRMQSQVEKAVTVAKERPLKNKEKEANNTEGSGSNSGNPSQASDSRDGVLGKISSSLNSKAPRRQLQIPTTSRNLINSLLSNEDIPLRSNASTPDALVEVTESLGNVDLNQQSKVRRGSAYAFTSVDQNSVLTRSGGRKFVLSLIETVYEEVLELEANLRSGKPTDNSKLWEALHINSEVYEVCPFISMLSFDKGVKIMPRIFNFLDREQKLKLLQTFFSELSHLNIIIISSYKTNPSPTDSQLKKIDLFQTVFLKIIVSFLSNSSNFIEIMGLLLHLIKNNNVSFISTSKIGLNLITVLISRAALIRQDTNRSNMLSSPEISTWNEIYDKLFTALESKLALVFPPEEYINKVIDISKSNQSGPTSSSAPQYYDQAYIWQFLASLALSGKLNHQRIIIDEVRDQIFGTINFAEKLNDTLKDTSNSNNGVTQDDIMYRREKLYQDLNLFLNVMGLVSRDGEITELK